MTASRARVALLSFATLAAGCLTQYELDRSGQATEGGSGSGGTAGASGSSTGGCVEMCNGLCVDPMQDERACGQCGVACRPGRDCVDGICQETCEVDCPRTTQLCQDNACVCRPGLVACDNGCVDDQTDPLHCGQCGRDCGAQFCQNGTCVAACAAPLVECMGGCVDTMSDELNCGGCGNACDADELCIAGDCRDWEPAPCLECPCEDCGSEVCCEAPPIEGVVCVNDDACE